MNFSFFQPTMGQTLAFVAIVVFVASNVLWIGRQAFPKIKVFFLVTALVGWMLAHTIIGRLEILRSDAMPPPLLFYMLATLGVGIYFSFSKWGKQIAQTTSISVSPDFPSPFRARFGQLGRRWEPAD